MTDELAWHDFRNRAVLVTGQNVSAGGTTTSAKLWSPVAPRAPRR
jgi:hypothetical protein